MPQCRGRKDHGSISHYVGGIQQYPFRPRLGALPLKMLRRGCVSAYCILNRRVSTLSLFEGGQPKAASRLALLRPEFDSILSSVAGLITASARECSRLRGEVICETPRFVAFGITRHIGTTEQ